MDTNCVEKSSANKILEKSSTYSYFVFVAITLVLFFNHAVFSGVGRARSASTSVILTSTSIIGQWRSSSGSDSMKRQVEELLGKGQDVNERSREGMTPLGIAAFWGYAEIAELLLENGADINLANKGTLWTPLHSAAFQGHGKVVMTLMQYNPDLTLKDNHGRTAVDFASAIDGIWSFFAAAGCKRTTKAQLIDMDIVKKVTASDPTIPRSDYAHFSRPGSAYVIKPQETHYSDARMAHASHTGDVLAGIPEEHEDRPPIPLYNSIWNS